MTLGDVMVSIAIASLRGSKTLKHRKYVSGEPCLQDWEVFLIFTAVRCLFQHLAAYRNQMAKRVQPVDSTMLRKFYNWVTLKSWEEGYQSEFVESPSRGPATYYLLYHFWEKIWSLRKPLMQNGATFHCLYTPYIPFPYSWKKKKSAVKLGPSVRNVLKGTLKLLN